MNSYIIKVEIKTYYKKDLCVESQLIIKEIKKRNPEQSDEIIRSDTETNLNSVKTRYKEVQKKRLGVRKRSRPLTI